MSASWKNREKRQLGERPWWLPGGDPCNPGRHAVAAHEYANPAECLADLKNGMDRRDEFYSNVLFEGSGEPIFAAKTDNMGKAFDWMKQNRLFDVVDHE